MKKKLIVPLQYDVQIRFLSYSKYFLFKIFLTETFKPCRDDFLDNYLQ